MLSHEPLNINNNENNLENNNKLYVKQFIKFYLSGNSFLGYNLVSGSADQSIKIWELNIYKTNF